VSLSVATIESGGIGEILVHVKHGGPATNLVASLAMVGARGGLGSTEHGMKHAREHRETHAKVNSSVTD
jgi:hypothetical protein